MSIETLPSQSIDRAVDMRTRNIDMVRESLLRDRSSLAWQAFAACRVADPDLFFPEVGANAKDIKEALKYCAKCDVKDLCLLYAISSGERFGIWGGMTPKPRNALARRITNGGRQW